MGNPLIQISGFCLIAVIVLTGIAGSTGICRQIGRGLAMPDDESRPWRRVLRGAIVLAMTFILPVIGWFVVLPLVLVSGFGVFLWARFSRRAKA